MVGTAWERGYIIDNAWVSENLDTSWQFITGLIASVLGQYSNVSSRIMSVRALGRLIGLSFERPGNILTHYVTKPVMHCQLISSLDDK